MATCPECDADLDVVESDIEEGDQVDCPECGESFVVTGTDPLELETSDDDDEEDEEEDDDAELEDEDDLEEDEEEEDEGDWEE